MHIFLNQTGTRRFLLGLEVLGLLLLVACNEKAPDGDLAARQQHQAEELAAEQLRADPSMGRDLVLQDVRSFAQAENHLVAVCGQMSITGPTGRFAPFVTTVNFTAGDAGKPEVTPFLATSSIEATRVYVETQSRCHDMRGPRPMSRMAAPPLLPAIPANLPYLRQPDLPAVATMPESVTKAASVTTAQTKTEADAVAKGSVITRQASNLRSGPSGGSVIRVISGGQSLQVYGTAPGGWYEVGDTSGPAGWVHGSMFTHAP